MKAFPLFLNVAGRPVIVVGGAEQAAQKARLVAKTEARLVLMAPDLDAELAARVAAGTATHVPDTVDASVFEGVDLVFVATGCPGADAAIAGVARARGALVNVVDRPALCDVTTPAIVDRDPLVVAIGSEGAAPVLARQIKSRLEQILEPDLGAFAALAGRLRARVERQVPKERRRAFWDWAFEGPRRLFTTGARENAIAAIDAALAAGGAPGTTGGQVSFVDVSHGEADLVALRAVARLQAADLIVHDEAVAPGVLELARRDAERLALAPGLDPAIARLREAVAEGARVVHLAALPWPVGEIAAALATDGVPIEQVGAAVPHPDAA